MIMAVHLKQPHSTRPKSPHQPDFTTPTIVAIIHRLTTTTTYGNLHDLS